MLVRFDQLWSALATQHAVRVNLPVRCAKVWSALATQHAVSVNLLADWAWVTSCHWHAQRRRAVLKLP